MYPLHKNQRWNKELSINNCSRVLYPVVPSKPWAEEATSLASPSFQILQQLRKLAKVTTLYSVCTTEQLENRSLSRVAGERNSILSCSTSSYSKHIEPLRCTVQYVGTVYAAGTCCCLWGRVSWWPVVPAACQ